MHPVRRNILVRWIGYVVVVLGMAGYIYTAGDTTPTFSSTVMQRLAPEKVSLPSEEVTKSIKSAISVLRGEKAAFAAVDTIEPTLIPAQLGVAGQGLNGMGAVRISALFMGPPDKFAILNGVAYKEGATLPDGRTLKSIKRDGVVLAMGDSVMDVPWIDPFRVELTKPSKDETKVFTPDTTLPQDQQDAQGSGAAGVSGQKVDVNNLPADLTPDQALEILQKMGNK